MSYPTDSCGRLTLQRKKYNYTFSRYKLTVYGDFTTSPIKLGSLLKGTSMLSEYEYFYIDSLLSITYGSGGKLVFGVGYVLRFQGDTTKISQIKLSGKIIDQFIRASKIKTERVGNEIRVTSNLLSEHTAKWVNVRSHRVEIDTQAVTSLSFNAAQPISKHSKVCLRFAEPLEIKSLASILVGIYQFFIFLYNTPKIDFDIECESKLGEKLNIGALHFKGYMIDDYFSEDSPLFPGNLMPKWEEVIAAFINSKMSEVSLGNLGDARYDKGRVIAIVSAFEELYRRTFGVDRSKNKEKVHRIIMGYLSGLETSRKLTSKQKDWLKDYRNLLSSKKDLLPLEQRINKVFDKFNTVTSKARKSSYHMNGRVLDSNMKASIRIARLRNDFSHRSRSSAFSRDTILDLRALEVVMYCIILNNIGVDDGVQLKLIKEIYRIFE